jgi:hypothetical protein
MMKIKDRPKNLICSKCGAWLENTGGDFSSCPDYMVCGSGLRRKLNRKDNAITWKFKAIEEIQPKLKGHEMIGKCPKRFKIKGEAGVYLLDYRSQCPERVADLIESGCVVVHEPELSKPYAILKKE